MTWLTVEDDLLDTGAPSPSVPPSTEGTPFNAIMYENVRNELSASVLITGPAGKCPNTVGEVSELLSVLMLQMDLLLFEALWNASLQLQHKILQSQQTYQSYTTHCSSANGCSLS